VTSNVKAELHADDVHIGPSDYVAWLDDRKWAFVRLEGRNFGDAPVSLEYKLEVWDSPNSAGVIIDAIRAAKIALGPRHRRTDPLGIELLHEVPAGAVRRRYRPREGRGVHPGRHRALIP
jgi:myo-inositol-1-phosphate synthase